jgi:arsenate reductase
MRTEAPMTDAKALAPDHALRSKPLAPGDLVLFMCVANSARSQLAEGLARRLAPPGVEVASAGSEPGTIRPEALAVLAERGIDASKQSSKGLDAIDTERVTHVVTLCAEEVCPVFLGDVVRLHWPQPDPAAAMGDEEARLDAFRTTRDALEARLREWFAQASTLRP